MRNWSVWRDADRSRLLNRLRRRVLASPRLAAIFWRHQARNKPVRAQLARKALEQRPVNETYWWYQDVRIDIREKRKQVRSPK